MKRASVLLAVAIGLFAPTLAVAAHTQDAVVYDPNTMVIQMAIVPDDDTQLDQAAFNPPSMIQMRFQHVDGADPIDVAVSQNPSLIGPKQIQQQRQQQLEFCNSNPTDPSCTGN